MTAPAAAVVMALLVLGAPQADARPTTDTATHVADVGVVQGVVRGSGSNAALAYARVEVVRDTIVDWTDERGVYRLAGLGQGEHRIQVVHPGHDTLAITLTVPGDRAIRLDMTLDARPGPEMDALADFEPIRVEFTLPALLNGAEIASILQRMYPPALTDDRLGGEAVLNLWLDEMGRVVRGQVSSSSGHRSLDSIALIVSDSMRFRPARRDRDGVRVIVRIPLMFHVPGSAEEPVTAGVEGGV